MIHQITLHLITPDGNATLALSAHYHQVNGAVPVLVVPDLESATGYAATVPTTEPAAVWGSWSTGTGGYYLGEVLRNDVTAIDPFDADALVALGAALKIAELHSQGNVPDSIYDREWAVAELFGYGDTERAIAYDYLSAQTSPTARPTPWPTPPAD